MHAMERRLEKVRSDCPPWRRRSCVFVLLLCFVVCAGFLCRRRRHAGHLTCAALASPRFFQKIAGMFEKLETLIIANQGKQEQASTTLV